MKFSVMKLTAALPLACLLVGASLFVGAEAYGQNNYYGRASTVGESHARGMSDVTRARGQANLDSSEASINRTEARSRELDNNLKSTETFFEMRRINHNERFGDYPERKAKNEQKRLFRYGEGKPKRLMANELDPVTGAINWPLPLRAPYFEDNRTELEPLFVERVYAEGGIGWENYSKIQAGCDALKKELKSHIKTMPSQHYTQAKDFVNRMSHESELETS